MKKSGAAAVAVIACALAACGGGNIAPNANPETFVQNFGPQARLRFTLPAKTIGEELPTEGVKTKQDPKWGLVGGFTQSTTAQVLAFPPNTKVTLENLSKVYAHTLNVIAKRTKAPAKFPKNPSLPVGPQGNGILALGYASGSIAPGKSVTVTMGEKGNYLIGCAFHYHEGMQDVIRIAAKATPGPTFVR